MTDWIRHTGNGCPVPPETIVDVEWHDGGRALAERAGFWSEGRDDFWRRPEPGSARKAYIRAWRRTE